MQNTTHDIYLGDCFNILKSLPDRSIDLVITDPPYGQDYSTGRRKNVIRKTTEIINDKGNLDIPKLFNLLDRVTKDESHIYVFNSWKTIDDWKKEFEKYFVLKNILIWSKDLHTAGDLHWSYAQSYEMILFGMKGRKKINGTRDRDCFFIDKVKGDKQEHLLQKPDKLISYLIEKSSNEFEWVLDPFTGSGTVNHCCRLLNRNSIGIEIEEKYFKTIKERLEMHDLYGHAKFNFIENYKKEK